MSMDRLARWLNLPETERVLDLLARRIAEGVMAGLEKSGLMAKLVEQIDKAQAAAQPAKPAEPPKLPPIPLKPEVALSLLKEQAAKRETALLRKPGARRTFVKPTVTYRVDPRKSAEASPGPSLAAPAPGISGPAVSFSGLTMGAGYPLPPPPPRPAMAKKEGTRAVFALLYEEKGRKILFGFINQVRFGRSDLVERVNQFYKDLPGVPLSEEDLMRAIHYHKLIDVLYKREEEIICRHLRKEKGSLVKTAQRLKMTPEKLNDRIQELKIEERVAAIRQEFCEQIIEQMDLRQKLDLALTKSKYLADLNIEQQVDSAIREELKDRLAQYLSMNEQERQQAVCQEFGLSEDLYHRLARRFGLEDCQDGGEQVPAQNAP